ncbi:SDR family NAD(P)-dependent oxidoreductase [Geomicrobium sp. JCM 19055]|nr:SDR family NAD(P)-dependent oxidoreductase [Geomicrobium sp. JCM 19055]
MSNELKGKTVIVTGGSSGLGLETARTLAKEQQANVIIAVRNVDKGKKSS